MKIQVMSRPGSGLPHAATPGDPAVALCGVEGLTDKQGDHALRCSVCRHILGLR